MGIISRPNNNPPKLRAKITIVRVKNILLIPPRFKSEAIFCDKSAFEKPPNKNPEISCKL